MNVFIFVLFWSLLLEYEFMRKKTLHCSTIYFWQPGQRREENRYAIYICQMNENFMKPLLFSHHFDQHFREEPLGCLPGKKCLEIVFTTYLGRARELACVMKPCLPQISSATISTCYIWIWVILGFFPEKWPASFSGAGSHILNFYFLHSLLSVITLSSILHLQNIYWNLSFPVPVTFLLKVTSIIIFWWYLLGRRDKSVCSIGHLPLAVP